MAPTPLQQALQGAPDSAPPKKPPAEQEFFCFRAGELRLGVPSENVREVIRIGPLTPLPRSPAFLLGVTGFRGEVLPVIDLVRFLGKGESRVGPRTRLFVGIWETLLTAVVVDQVIGLRKIPVQEILPAPIGGDSSVEHLLGVVRGAKGEGFSLLNFAKLLVVARQKAVGR